MKFWGGPLCFFLTCFVIYVSSTVLHEGAHAVTALATGHDLYAICIGFQAPYRYFKILGVWLILGHPLRGGGFCLPLLRTVPRRQPLLHIVAGPFASLLAATGLVAVAIRLGGGIWSYTLVAAAVLNGYYGIFSLFPARTVGPYPIQQSDGGILLNALRCPANEIRQRLIRDYAGGLCLRGRQEEAFRILREGAAEFPDDPEFRMCLAGQDMSSEESFRIMESISAMPIAAVAHRAKATLSMMLAGRASPGDLQRADQLSLEAYTHHPEDPTTRLARYVLLEATGRSEEGFLFLSRIHREFVLPTDRGILAAELGHREARRGVSHRARQLLKEAELLEAPAGLVSELRAALETA